ncbi:MAG: hypothetical protein ACKVS6_09990 [Planctomycetota bacterium]
MKSFTKRDVYRYLLFNISTSLVLVIAGCGKQVASLRPPLADYLNRKLESKDRSKINELYEKMTGDELYGKYEDLAPKLIVPFHCGAARFAIISTPTSITIPGYCTFHIAVFDQNWNLLSKEYIEGGYRMTSHGASVERNTIVNADLIIFRSGSAVLVSVEKEGERVFDTRPESVQIQYIGFDKNKFHIVRLTNGEGKIRSRYLSSTVPGAGPPREKLTKDQWIERLQSLNIIERLDALVWLTGSHKPSSEPRYENVTKEPLEDALMFESVRDDPRTRAIIAKLRTDTNPWVRECAELWTWGK